MKRTYFYCDRCGAELDIDSRSKCLSQLKPLRIDVHGKYYFRDKDSYLDLCYDCSCEFHKWLTEFDEDLCDQDF